MALPFSWSQGVYSVSGCAFGVGAWGEQQVPCMTIPPQGENTSHRRDLPQNWRPEAGAREEIRHMQAINPLNNLRAAAGPSSPYFVRGVDIHTEDVAESNPGDWAQNRGNTVKP